MAHAIRTVFFFVLLTSNSLSGQIIVWSENFDSYANGVVTGADNNLPVGNDWTSGGCTTCPASSGDYWEVRGGLMEARDINDETGYLQTEVIDISGYVDVSFSVEVSETGDLEGPYLSTDNCVDENNQDFADVSYRVDGGPWTKVTNYLGWCGLYNTCNSHTLQGDDGSSQGDCRSSDSDWGVATVIVNGIVGNTLELLLEVRNSSGSEYIRIDDIEVLSTSPLPVIWGAFEGKYQALGNLLTWTTLSEISNDRFLIERSVEGTSFEVIAQIPGNGNSSQSLSYSFLDRKRSHEGNYYRIKQIDYDGTEHTGPLIFVEENWSSEEIEVSPNPSVDFIQIAIPEESGPVHIQVYSMDGSLELTSSKTNDLDIRSLSDGIHHLVLIATNRVYSTRFIKSPNR